MVAPDTSASRALEFVRARTGTAIVVSAMTPASAASTRRGMSENRATTKHSVCVTATMRPPRDSQSLCIQTSGHVACSVPVAVTETRLSQSHRSRRLCGAVVPSLRSPIHTGHTQTTHKPIQLPGVVVLPGDGRGRRNVTVGGTPESGTSFGQLLRQLRQDANLSQEALAARSGLSLNAVSMLERGVRRSPRRSTVELLSRALRLAPDDARALLDAGGWTSRRASSAAAADGR